MRPRTFFAAKINIHGNIFSPDLKELIDVHIPRVILDSSPIKVNSWNWSSADVTSNTINQRNIISGNVTKSKFQNQKVRIGTKTVDKKTDDEIAHTAFFVYDPTFEILAYETTSKISESEFRNLFTQLLSSDFKVGEVKIIPIPIPHKIRQEILSLDKITSVQFNLIHPNPGRDEFNEYQRIIDDTGIKELTVSMSNKDGFQVLKPITANDKEKEEEAEKVRFKDSIESGIALVESGYGDASIAGYNESLVKGKRKDRVEKRKKRFSSKNSIQRVKIVEYEKENLIKKLSNFIFAVKNKQKSDGESIGK